MRYKSILLIIGGVFAGLVNGILGGGAGVIVVLLLSGIVSLQQRQAQATALLVVLPMTILSAVLYICNGSIPLWDTVIVCVACTIGGLVGALLLGKTDNRWAKLIFAILLCIGGVRMIWVGV